MIRIRAYAKVNYTLDILSKRPDGYHNLATVMQTLSLHDTLEVERAPSDVRLECGSATVPTDDRNLAVAAARALLRSHGRTDGLRLRLHKVIPTEAGLGGGSSDAAAALRAVDLLLGLRTPAATMAAIAAEVGSDVPFFLVGGTASARGRGERLQALPDGPLLHGVIVKPAVGVATGPAFAALDALPNRRSARGTRRMEAALRSGGAGEVLRGMTNDFEAVVLATAPEVAAAYDSLLMARSAAAILCGSGSSVLGFAPSASEAEAMAACLSRAGLEAYPCATVTREQAMEAEYA